MQERKKFIERLVNVDNGAGVFVMLVGLGMFTHAPFVEGRILGLCYLGLGCLLIEHHPISGSSPNS